MRCFHRPRLNFRHHVVGEDFDIHAELVESRSSEVGVDGGRDDLYNFHRRARQLASQGQREGVERGLRTISRRVQKALGGKTTRRRRATAAANGRRKKATTTRRRRRAT